MKHETFTVIYDRYAEMIMKSVVAQTRDRELAKEICQQTFEIYFRKMDTVKPGSEKSWLLKVSRNLLIDYWRKASTKREILKSDTDDSQTLDSISGSVEKMSEDRLFVCELLDDLREHNRNWYEAVERIYVLQESYEEAAKQLGTTSTVLRARVKRAKSYIREKYGADYLER